MTELDRLKVLSALKLGYGKLTAKNTTEKEFENIEQAIEIVKKLTIPVVSQRSELLLDFVSDLDEIKWLDIQMGYKEKVVSEYLKSNNCG